MSDSLQHYGIKGMKWGSAREYAEARQGYLHSNAHKSIVDKKRTEKAGAMYRKAPRAKVRVNGSQALSTVSKATVAVGQKMIEAMFRGPDDVRADIERRSRNRQNFARRTGW